MPKREEVLAKLDELIDIVKAGRNPSAVVPAAPVTPTHRRTERPARKQVSELVGAFKDIQAALDEDDQEGAQDIVSEVLSDPDYADSDDD